MKVPFVGLVLLTMSGSRVAMADATVPTSSAHRPTEEDEWAGCGVGSWLRTKWTPKGGTEKTAVVETQRLLRWIAVDRVPPETGTWAAMIVCTRKGKVMWRWPSVANSLPGGARRSIGKESAGREWVRVADQTIPADVEIVGTGILTPAIRILKDRIWRSVGPTVPGAILKRTGDLYWPTGVENVGKERIPKRLETLLIGRKSVNCVVVEEDSGRLLKWICPGVIGGVGRSVRLEASPRLREEAGEWQVLDYEIKK